MPRQVYSFDPPERFVLGTVGQPGERVFYLQASGGGRIVSVALEKVQARVLAEQVTHLLDEVRRRGGDVPPVAPPELEDVAPLDQPIFEDFRVGRLGLAWDGEGNRVLIEAQAFTEGDDSDDSDDDEDEGELEEIDDAATDGPDVLRVRIDPAAARAFVKRSERVLAAGRPPCPLCGNPLDPQGHFCPRQNGHRH